MIVLTSGAYLNFEFESLLGKLPPAFLPVGNKRLWEWQVKDLKDLDEEIALTIPMGFDLPAIDEQLLAEQGLTVLRVPENLNLGQSVVYAITALKINKEPVRILHGDTLCLPISSSDTDFVLTGRSSTHYAWAELEPDEEHTFHLADKCSDDADGAREVLAGYFSFADAAELARCIALENFDFVKGLNLYSQANPLITARADTWLDFGHVITYFQSKAQHTTERAFNQLSITERWIEKSSSDSDKITAEAVWFEALPMEIRPYTPQYFGRVLSQEPSDRPRYRLEYLYNNTLSEIAVFGRLPVLSWQVILRRCAVFLNEARAFSQTALSDGAPLITSDDYTRKTLGRLKEFASASGFDIDAPMVVNDQAVPSLRKMVDELAPCIEDAKPSDLGLLHGDFCFSNILYDFRSDQIRVIDPRGRDFQGEIGIWGDTRYDLAKLAHSVVGLYDFIIAGRYRLDRHDTMCFDLRYPEHDRTWDGVQNTFKQLEIGGRRSDDPGIQAMTIQLFLSMLPLHYDRPDRQQAFIANAARMFIEFEG